MKKLLINFLLYSSLILCYSTACAQSPDKILKRAIKAAGGEKILRGVQSIRMDGKITRLNDGASGKFQARAAQSNFYTSSFDVDGYETAIGFNGKSGWRRDSKNGLRTLTGDASRDLQTEANYRINRWLNYKKEKSKIVYGGQAEVSGRAAEIVTLTNTKGATIKMYFDKISGLLIRDEILAGDSKHTFDYADFRAVDEIQEPFSIVSTINNEKYEIKLDSVAHNAQIAKSVFDFPKISYEPLPDIPTLLKELQANQQRIEDILESYAYTQTNTTRELGKDGVLREKESKTFQSSFYKGKRIRRLIAKNGKPLSTDEQAKEDETVGKRVAELEKQAAKKQAKIADQAAGETSEENEKRVSLAELLRASNLINPRRERFRGREVIVFDFEPNPNFDYKNAKSFLKFFGKMAGVIWIDAQDKQVARLEAVLAENFKIGGGILANLQKGGGLTFENERVNNEVWLPSLADMNMSLKILLVKEMTVNQAAKYSDYRKFDTEVKDSKVNEILKP